MTAVPAGPTHNGISLYAFPQAGSNQLARAFYPDGAPVIEVRCAAGVPDAAIARAYDTAVARGGIPVVSRGGAGPFVQALLDTPHGIEAMAAARRARADGPEISAADANVAATLAAGFPTWTGGIAHYEPGAVPA